MVDAAKIQLSTAEMALASDPSWILTKNSIMGKAVALMAELSGEFRREWSSWAGGGIADGASVATLRSSEPVPLGGVGNGGPAEPMGHGDFPQELFGTDPKISRGENYKGLPYVILDYPRIFGREDVFAVRTMFWWGHPFHVTLHLKGKYQAMFLPVIRQRLSMLATAGFQVAVSEDEWQHELSAENYRLIGERDLDHLPFLKLAAPCPLDKWNDAHAVLLELFRVVCRSISGL